MAAQALFFTAELQSRGGGPALCAGLETAQALGSAGESAAVPSLCSGRRPAPLPLGHGCCRLLERVRCQKPVLGAACVSSSPGCSEPRSLFPGKPRWSRLLWAALQSEQACPRASLPCLPLLWLTFCSRRRIRQDDAQGFSGAPQKAPSQPNFSSLSIHRIVIFLKQEREEWVR